MQTTDNRRSLSAKLRRYMFVTVLKDRCWKIQPLFHSLSCCVQFLLTKNSLIELDFWRHTGVCFLSRPKLISIFRQIDDKNSSVGKNKNNCVGSNWVSFVDFCVLIWMIIDNRSWDVYSDYLQLFAKTIFNVFFPKLNFQIPRARAP